VKTGGSWFVAHLGKVSIRPYLKNRLKAKGLGGHDSSGRVLALQVQGPEFNPYQPQTNKQNKTTFMPNLVLERIQTTQKIKQILN
jgi:hypothetical protein